MRKAKQARNLKIQMKKKNNFFKPINAGGGVLYQKRDNGILVCLIKRRRVWDLPKGKQEESESIEACAVREVEEELGINGVKIVGELIKTQHSYEDRYGCWNKTTHWFLMSAPEQEFSVQKEEHIEKAVWLDLASAIEKVAFQNLRDVLGSVREYLSNSN